MLTRPSRSRVAGFDYRTGREVTRSRREWRADLAQVVADGGDRRVHHGETFAHGRDGKILFEVYAILPKVAVLALAVSLAGCASAPGLYVESGLSAADVKYAEIAITGPNSWHFASRSHNPFAEIAVGYRLALSQRVSAEIAVSHESSIATGNDRGVNSASVSVRWFPFNTQE